MKPDLKQLVTHWQAALRLLDWRLQVEYVRDLASSDGRPCYGLCSPFVDGKRARILIRDPETPITRGGDPHVEETLIHELLHLHFAPLAENTTAGIAAEEQAVWAITEAMTSTKDVGQRARLARAFVGAAQFSAARRERHIKMDPILLAALEAAAASDDPKAQIEALLASLKGGGAAGSETPPAAQAAAPAAGAEEPKAPMAAAAPGAAAPRAALPAPRAALPAPRATVPASTLVSRHEFAELQRDLVRDRIERLVDKRPDLNEAQRAHALAMPTAELAEGFLKVTPAAAAAEGAAPTARAQRAASPTTGARATGGAGDEQRDEIRKRMGTLDRDDAPAVKIDRSGRLTISSLKPVRLEKGGV